MMVTRKGRRTKLIKQLQEIIYDIGKPASAAEILSGCAHLRYAPTMNQLCMMLRRHREFTIIGTAKRKTVTGNYDAKLYWLSNTDEISKLLKCTICERPMAKRHTHEAQMCSECYKAHKRKERRPEPKKMNRRLCVICKDEITDSSTKYCSDYCRKIGYERKRKERYDKLKEEKINAQT